MARSQKRRFFVRRKGYIGLGPKELFVNDQLCVFAGSRVPHILHQRNKDFRAFNESPRIEYEWCGEVDIGATHVTYVKRTREEKFQLIGELCTQGLISHEIWKENAVVLEDFIFI